MSTEELKTWINLFVDGELDKEKEPILFTQLSQNDEARDYLKQVNMIRSAVDKTAEEFPVELEERIYSSIRKTEENKNLKFSLPKIFMGFSYAMAIILIFASVFLFSKMNDYKNNLEAMARQIGAKNQMIETLFNSLPPALVNSKITNPVIVRAKI